MSNLSEDRSVLVAMSGGVDSCASALLLQDSGHEVVGVSMQVWDYRNHGGSSSRATCCAPADFDDARVIAEKAGFPFYVFDFEQSFKGAVIDPFVDSYLNGYTPNPCMDCNRKVKFRALRERASALGINKIATGHYARIRKESNGSWGLFTGKDENKDQSYFLYAMKQSDLKETLFPVGDMEKPQVRDYLKQRGFSLSEKPESQDICFVSKSVSEFVEKHAGVSGKSGQIVNSQGTVVGEHRGIHNFTIGQRKGLRLSAKSPLYVLNIDSKSHRVTVGEKEELSKGSFCINSLTWTNERSSKEPFEALVKVRYRHEGLLCRVSFSNEREDEAKVEFLENWEVLSPGQAAVFYDLQLENDAARRVLGGGIIMKEENASSKEN